MARRQVLCWVAAMATGLTTVTLADQSPRRSAKSRLTSAPPLVPPVFDFLNATPHRVPMTDWYWTHDATKTGFQARSVVGGVFLKLLYDDVVWKKWSRRQ